MRPSTTMLALVSLLAAPALVAGPAEDFHALLDEAWEWQLETSPLFASRLGDRRYNDRWTDMRLSAIRERHEATRAFLDRLYAIDRQALDETDRLNHELFRRELQNDVDAFAFNGHLMPFSHSGGIQTLETSTDTLPIQTVADYEDWLARLGSVDELIEQVIDLAEEGRRRGYVAPRVLMERVPDQLAAQVVDDPEESPFYAVFASMPDAMPAAEQARLKAAARKVIADVLLPAYRRLERYFTRSYLPDARDTIGLSALPAGEAWYEFRTRYYTTTRMTPDEIHRLGLDEVARIRNEMETIIAEVGFSGGFDAFLEHLRTEPRFYYDDPDELYEAYLATSKRIDPELVRLFGKLPRMPYGVKPIPAAIAPDTTTAYYTRPAADGSRAGIFWVNLYKPEVRPKYEIEVLTVHEAMPGHHLQIALQQELGEMPNFRRFSGFTAFVEGWGLYSESLGYELGLYADPYSRFGALTYEMWRAIRLVVDTGMHYRGWTRQQAIDFFTDNAAKTEQDIVNEIDRYISWPGQALAYKVGQLRIRALRTEAETALGDDFDVRAFHDHLLGAGALPLDLLEQRMDGWLAARLAERAEAERARVSSQSAP